MKRGELKILKLLLLAFFIAYYSTSTLFVHTHKYAGGTITHSHPFLPSAKHSHTTSEYQLIDHINHLVFWGAIVALVFLSLPILYFKKYILSRPFYLYHRPGFAVLKRGPPVY